MWAMPRPYTAMDVIARKKRMDGYNVLFPIGYDAFGLPTENFAIKNHVHPAKVTKDNIANFTTPAPYAGLLLRLGPGGGHHGPRLLQVDPVDLPSAVSSTAWPIRPSMPVNWCTSCKCVLANEEVVEGVCERCGSPRHPQGKEPVDAGHHQSTPRPPHRRSGRLWTLSTGSRPSSATGSAASTGAEVVLQGHYRRGASQVFTTRPDTLFGATYMVLSPEHALRAGLAGERSG